MFDFSKSVGDFHDSHVSLTQDQTKDMQSRRDKNIERIDGGLKDLSKPSYAETISQGGNAMRTMTQPPEKDEESRYDIDEGIVFNESDTKTPKTTKDWVRDALKKRGSNFKEEPASKPKCVRVVYSDGYQCDFPVLRRRYNGKAWEYEIAINDEWKASDPKAMNVWFEDRVKKLSPNEEGGYQLRRIVRMLKYFAKVHSYRTRTKFPAGLVATALCVECYVPKAGRDDESFYETLKNIRDRSEGSSVVANGVVISDDKDKDRIKRLRDAAKEAVDALDALTKDGADEKEARKAWKSVFRHSYFDAVDKSASASSISDADRLRRAEAAAAGLAAAGAGEKPWKA